MPFAEHEHDRTDAVSPSVILLLSVIGGTKCYILIRASDTFQNIVGLQKQDFCALCQEGLHHRRRSLAGGTAGQRRFGRRRPRRRGDQAAHRSYRKGRSGGSRSIVVFRKNNRAVYVYGFEKKDVANIDRRELEAFRELAKVILGYTDAEVEQRVTDGALFAVEEPGEENGKETSE